MGGLIAAAAAGPARLGGGGAVEIPWLRIVVALVLCTMVAVLVVLWLRRRGGGWTLPGVRGEARIEVIESRRLNQYADLSLVRVQGRGYAILSGAQAHHVLSSVPEGEA